MCASHLTHLVSIPIFPLRGLRLTNAAFKEAAMASYDKPINF